MRRPQRKKRRKVRVPVASMGDIAFLLIIFFLLLGKAGKDKDIKLTLPTSSQVEKPGVTVVAYVSVDGDGVIYVDGKRVSSADVVESRIKRLLEKTVADEQRHVQFKCDASLSREKFEPVLKAIAEAGGIVEAVGEKQ